VAGAVAARRRRALRHPIGNQLFARLRLLGGGSARRCRQLQNRRLLAFAQARHQHDLAVGELERIVMRARVLLVDVAETCDALAGLALGEEAEGRLTSRSNATSVPGSRHTATFGWPTAEKPRVIELVNLVEVSLSPTFAGRDATWCRL